jgi:hypothetical protein
MTIQCHYSLLGLVEWQFEEMGQLAPEEVYG